MDYDARGTIENMGSDSGFTTLQALCELIDNSISAMKPNQNKIKILLKKIKENNLFAMIDGAIGMNEEELRIANKLNTRTKSSSTKHGRFGCGGNHAQVLLSEKKTSHFISRYEEAEPHDASRGICEVLIDLNKLMNDENYKPTPHGASSKSEQIWKNLAIEPEKTGTIIIFDKMSDKLFYEIKEAFETKEVTESYKYNISEIYADFIKSGLEIIIQIDIDGIISNHPISVALEPLMWSNESVHFKYQTEHLLEPIMINEKTEWVFKEGNKWYSIKANKKHERTDYISSSNNQATLRCSFKPWGDICNNLISTLGLSTNKKEDKKKPKEIDNFGYSKHSGSFYKRNGKMISHIPLSRTGTGGDAITQKIKTYARFEISFYANETMDKLFNITINKSRIDTDGIDKNLIKTTDFLKDIFRKETEKSEIERKKLGQETETEQETDQEPDKETMIPKSVAKKPATAPVTKPATAPVTKPPTTPVTKPPTTPVTKPPTTPVTKPPTTLTKPPTTSVTKPPIVVNEPKTSIAPISKPAMNIAFSNSKTDSHLLIHEKNEIKSKIPYTGQYNITEKYYNEYLMKLGEKRFMEFINECDKLGVHELFRKYLN
jgi:hypothetical protein